MKPETLAEVWRLIRHPSAANAKAINAILARHVEQPAETEEQAAERELGAWLVAHVCSSWEHGWSTHPDGHEVHTVALRLEAYDPRDDFEGVGPTRAAAIREALRLAKETNNAD